METRGEFLKRLSKDVTNKRKELDISRKKLAEMSGVKVGHIIAMENEGRIYPMYEIEAMLDALGMDDYFAKEFENYMKNGS
jgi:predicted transcriptional regulator